MEGRIREGVAPVVSYDTKSPGPASAVSYETGGAPSPQLIAAYQAQFDFFNRALFGGELPHVVLNFSRHAKALGFFAPERWTPREAPLVYDPEHLRDPHAPPFVPAESNDVATHEISLNPTYLKRRSPRDTSSTLVHEMVHLWQEEFGKKKSRRGYHNREWGDKMEEVGLMPSSTAMPGGKKTGQRMSHYEIEGGAFSRAFDRLPPEYALPWVCEDLTETKASKRTKTKYTCPGCDANVWGKADLVIECRSCGETFEEITQ